VFSHPFIVRVDNRCSPTSALVVDAARQCRSVRSVFARGIQRYLKAFEGRLPKIHGKSRDAAINTLAGMVGAMVLARAIGDADDELSREILRAARKETAGRVTGAALKS
jgi:TetR/AcrR family transcriptional repressor of nem operon